MKRTLFLVCLFATPAVAQSSHTVRGYVRSDGTYVAPHTQTDSNSTKLDNWSTKGNVNPYNGQSGTVDPYRPTQANPYGTPNNATTNNPYQSPYNQQRRKPYGF